MFRLLAMTLPILGLEASARIYWVRLVEPTRTDQDLYEGLLGERVLDAAVPYKFFPDREFMVAGTPTSTNNLALRGDYAIDLSRPYTGTRILCVGDSVTFGYTVSGNEAAYPAVLERILRGERIECQVLNAGMPRFRMQHLAIFFNDYLRDYGGDLVVILGGWNNANDQILKPSGERSWTAIVNEHWYMFRVVRHWGVLPETGGREHQPARIDPAGYRQYGAALARLVFLSRDSGSEPVLCTLPHFFDNLSDEAAREKAGSFTPLGTLAQLAEVAEAMNQEIRAVGARLQVPVIDLSSIDHHEQFGDAIHPNDDGSAAIARLVADDLLESDLLSRRRD